MAGLASAVPGSPHVRRAAPPWLTGVAARASAARLAHGEPIAPPPVQPAPRCRGGAHRPQHARRHAAPQPFNRAPRARCTFCHQP
ncbi:hypothetical protein AQ611_15965 [Burkholderia singularis]|nr:hypothetical protein AQ611_15965 [Burkholderia sp. Bp7605]